MKLSDSGVAGCTAAIAAICLMALPAPGQTGGDATVIYEREVFQYPASGRPDPFRSLVNDAELGIRVEDLTLRGIVYHSDPSQSVAVLSQAGSERRIRARVGERVGSLRILAIYPDRVELVVEELGVARRETLRIQRVEEPDGDPT